MIMTQFPSVDLRSVPFSRYGSYFAISDLAAADGLPAGLYLRTIHGGVSRRQLFQLEVLHDNQPAEYHAVFRPGSLTLTCDQGWVAFCFSEPDRLRVRGKGVSLRMTMQPRMYDYAIPIGDDQFHINTFTHYLKFNLCCLSGKLADDAPWSVDVSKKIVFTFDPDLSSQYFEGYLDEYIQDPRPDAPSESFDESVRKIEEEFSTYYHQAPEGTAEFEPARMLAAYVNWASVVRPEGHLRRYTMFMSKNWMTNVWAWDHCFNALALAENNPALAWDQFNTLFDMQAPSGLIPDFYNDARQCWNYTKPPVHGWTLAKLMELGAVSKEQLQEIYPKIALWTEWWFQARDSDGDGIPEYYHGNDSGWDNATVFSVRPPVESPDLSAFLVLQMDTLSVVAETLGRPEDSRRWKERADGLLEKFIAHSWKGSHFAAPHSGTHDSVGEQSLILLIPLVLGRRLPETIRSELVARLKEGSFLTEHGLATESPHSPYYESDGYWRGPIWAPPTYILVDGLLQCGEDLLAKDIARRFCLLASKSGFAENYDALTGQPRRDLAYTWTSSVFLLLNQIISRP
jgi:glycogen debranching enzyme